jgi:Na+-translocating ferredoxin:NAD+ oxidoreductase RnfE subunit
MNDPYPQNSLFWGSRSPLSTLIGLGLIIMASSRTAFALVTLAALVWVYALTALVFRLASQVLPKKGKDLTIITVSAFFGGVYYIIFCLISPFLAAETSLFIILTPVCCIAAGVLPRIETMSPKDALIQAAFEALSLGLLILAFALVREPLGFGSLSLPGGLRGTVEIFDNGKDTLFPIQIISSSAGALLLFGYGLAMYRREKKRQFRKEPAEETQEEP